MEISNKRPLVSDEYLESGQPSKKRQRGEEEETQLESLPPEVLERIFCFAFASDFKEDRLQSFASNKTVCALSATSKRIREIAFSAYDLEKKKVIRPLLETVKGISLPAARATATVLQGLMSPTKMASDPISKQQISLLIKGINRNWKIKKWPEDEGMALFNRYFKKKESNTEELKTCQFLLLYLSKISSEEEITSFLSKFLPSNHFRTILQQSPPLLLKIAIMVAARKYIVMVLNWFKENQKEMLFYQDAKGYTLAHAAAKEGNTATLNWIEQQKELYPLLESVDIYKRNIAMLACIEKRISILEWVKDREALHPLFQGKNCHGLNIADLAASFGMIESLHWIKNEGLLKNLLFPDKDQWNIAHYAARYNHDKLLNWIYQEKELKHLIFAQIGNSGNIVHTAARSGSLLVFDWIIKKGAECSALEALITSRTSQGLNCSHVAASNDFMNVLKRLEQTKYSNLLWEKDPDLWNIAHFAAINGKVEILKWIQQNSTLKPLITQETENKENLAILGSHYNELRVLKWLKEEQDPLLRKMLKSKNKRGNNIAHVAATKGHLEILDWIFHSPDLYSLLFEKGQYSRSIASNTAGFGQPKVLHWLMTSEDLALQQLLESKKINENIVFEAAANDQIEVLQWVYTHPKYRVLLFETNSNSSNIALIAAASGHVKVLEWLEKIEDISIRQLLRVKNKFGNNIAHLAACSGHVDVLNQIYKNSELKDLLFETSVESLNIALCTVEKGKVNVLNWIENFDDLRGLLKGKGKDETNLALWASIKNQIIILEWIKERSHYHELFHDNNSFGCNLAYLAARNNFPETLSWINNQPLLQYLFLEEDPRGKFNIAHGAARYNCIQSLNWLNDYYPALLEVIHHEEGNIAHMAVRRGHLDVLRWIKDHMHLQHLLVDKDYLDVDSAQLASELNQTKVLEWMSELIKEEQSKEQWKDWSLEEVDNLLSQDADDMVI